MICNICYGSLSTQCQKSLLERGEKREIWAQLTRYLEFRESQAYSELLFRDFMLNKMLLKCRLDKMFKLLRKLKQLHCKGKAVYCKVRNHIWLAHICYHAMYLSYIIANMLDLLISQIRKPIYFLWGSSLTFFMSWLNSSITWHIDPKQNINVCMHKNKLRNIYTGYLD